MDPVIDELWMHAQNADQDLQIYLAEKGSSFPDIAPSLTRYRLACEDVILQDFSFAQSKEIENLLWDAHGKIHSRFRKEFKTQENGRRKVPVKQRKATKNFLDFIKSSQRFYRGYIQRLASRFDGIPELQAVASRLTLSTLSIDEPTHVSDALRRFIFLSCHQTLVRLGDLSRWRETQIATKDRNWGPAKGYYELAGVMYPSSGASHNQLAVIALVDVDHLRATYHLYRALAVDEPHPSAKGNLEIEFRKIEETHHRGGLITNGLNSHGFNPRKALVGRFVRLHAHCYKGLEFQEHEELESEVLSQIVVDLKDLSLDGAFNKFVLINIAAEFYAGLRLQEESSSSESLRSFFFFQRLNVRTFLTLLRVLLSELERCSGEDEQKVNAVPKSGSSKITAVTRRILPGLRQYSSWLMSNAEILAAEVGDTSLNTQIKDLWKIYAKTLTLLTSTFSVSSLPLVDYLLEEDEDTLGFKPFLAKHSELRYFGNDGVSQKPKWHDKGVQRNHPNVEMLARIRGFLTDGMFLHCQARVPVSLVKGSTTFTYVEKGVPVEESYYTNFSSTILGNQEITHIDGTTLPDRQPSIDGGASQAVSVSASMEFASNRTVDDLVKPETIDDSEDDSETGHRTGNKPIKTSHLIPHYFLGDSRSLSEGAGNETSYGLISSSAAREHFGDQLPPSPRPVLPSIYNSPFAPKPGEAAPNSRPNTVIRTTPGHSQQNSQTALPFQYQAHAISVDSSLTDVPESSNFNASLSAVHGNHPIVNARFPPPLNHTSGPRYSTVVGKENAAVLDDIGFFSETVFAGSSWVGTGHSGHAATNMQTPPNGQGIE